MKIIDNLNEFVEKIDNMKKINPLDLSSDQDLSIAIMNLISIEEHLFFSGAKTGDSSFYDLIETIREDRKELLKKIIKTYKGEVWCISKHLLAGCMRLMEVGTKAIGSNKKEEAYYFFEKAYNLYTLFWGLNLSSMNEKEVKSEIGKIDKKIIDKIENDTEDPQELQTLKEHPVDKKNDKKVENGGKFNKLKSFVSKAIDCCRE
ncbi:MAG: hypothetical protein LBC92_01590 [Rickettsiales bacterium]|jgi:hypothetical protein|nr:hypothetical protein [Rickettsiales bacterium]